MIFSVMFQSWQMKSSEIDTGKWKIYVHNYPIPSYQIWDFFNGIFYLGGWFDV